MSSPVPRPYFPVPPREYSQQYLAEVVRSFSIFLDTITNPGKIVGSQLNLLPDQLPVYADNSAAKAGGLSDGDVYRTSTGDLKIVYT